MKECEKCKTAPADAGYRFCRACRNVVLREMKQSGYLTETRVRPVIGEHTGRKCLNPKAIGGSMEILDDGDDT